MSRVESTIPNQNETNFTGSIWYTSVQLTQKKKLQFSSSLKIRVLNEVNDRNGIIIFLAAQFCGVTKTGVAFGNVSSRTKIPNPVAVDKTA